MTKVYFKNLGLIDYQQAWDFQEELFKKNVDAKIENRKAEHIVIPTTNYLIFCEHPHVYTLGKSGDKNHLLLAENTLKQIGASFFKINRGATLLITVPVK